MELKNETNLKDSKNGALIWHVVSITFNCHVGILEISHK